MGIRISPRSIVNAIFQMIFLLINVLLLRSATAVIVCPSIVRLPPVSRDTIYDFGIPAVLVTSKSQALDPYSLVDRHRRTNIFHQYLMVNYIPNPDNKPGVREELSLILYDDIYSIDEAAVHKPDLVRQNLKKQYYWGYIKGTGVSPSIIIKNTTTFSQYTFEPTENDFVSFQTTIHEREIYHEPQVPLDVSIEIPTDSRALREEKTLIQYQTFTLWRWKLSNKIVVWSDIRSVITNTVPYNRPNCYGEKPMYDVSRCDHYFDRIDNPCIKDMFVLYVHRKDISHATDSISSTNSTVSSSSDTPPNTYFYIGAPLIQSQLQENWFYDMSSDPELPWVAANPKEQIHQIILTNDHLVVLTESSLWISESLNSTLTDVHLNATEKRLLKYTRTYPCSKQTGSVACFNDSKTTHKLYYNPVCYLYQYPDYDDHLIYVTGDLENKTRNIPHTEYQGLTVFYAVKPYTEWKLLFSDVFFYCRMNKKKNWLEQGKCRERYKLGGRGLAGIFFNNHLRHFDLTLELSSFYIDPKKFRHVPPYRYIRIALPEPVATVDGYGDIILDQTAPKLIVKELTNVMGDGFVEYLFPHTFRMSGLAVNGDTQDVLFLGNQLYIAEAGNAFVYTSIIGFKELSPNNSMCLGSVGYSLGDIKECSFNHPDRTYLCLNEDRRLLLTGRIGSRYSPNVIVIDDIQELIQAQKVNAWTKEEYCNIVQLKSQFIASFSGNILMWYMHETSTITKAQVDALAKSSANCSTIKNAADPEPVLCSFLMQWKEKNCTAEETLTGDIFRTVKIGLASLVSRKENSDGPLVPFFVDPNTLVLYEGSLARSDVVTNEFRNYFSEVNVGQQIYCINYRLLKNESTDPYLRHACELFTRHVKPLSTFIKGFRLAMYVTVAKPIPMYPVPAYIVILKFPNSNKCLVKVHDVNNAPPGWSFNFEHVGQTLYLPGSFSVLLTGFPIGNSHTLDGKITDFSVMVGYATMYSQHQIRVSYHPFGSFLLDMSTTKYRQSYKENGLKDLINQETSRLRKAFIALDLEYRKKQNKKKKIQEKWEKSPFSWEGNPDHPLKNTTATSKMQIFDNTYGLKPSYAQLLKDEKELLSLSESDYLERLNKTVNVDYNKYAPDPETSIPIELLAHSDNGKHANYDTRQNWYVSDGECNYIMSLKENKVLFSHGGRVNLDLHDRLSFEVRLRSTTTIGAIMMYRPLLVVTNSNPSILKVTEKQNLKGNPQYTQILLAPTGLRTGVAVVTVRNVVTSLKCTQSTTMTFIVQIYREYGRRLYPNYPIPVCNPLPDFGRYPRKWVEDINGCITRDELLEEKTEANNGEILRYHFGRPYTAFVTLPINYRPPSSRGADIPISKHVYNADPSAAVYKTWYKISKDSFEWNECKDAESKEKCQCTENDRMSDDEIFSECKEKVFNVRRTGNNKPIFMSMDYDRIMPNSEQIEEFFTPKLNWSGYIEEVNGRTEWFIYSESSAYLDTIKNEETLNKGKTFYNMKGFNVTLLGTGLFHFKATLGQFESFNEVSGYFLLYANPDELNHIQMFIILLVTMTLCFTIVFLGFISVRKRLSSQLPIQPMSHKKQLKLL